MNKNIALLKEQLAQAISKVKEEIEELKNMPYGLHIDLASGDIKNTIRFDKLQWDAFIKSKREELKQFPKFVEVIVLHEDKEGFDLLSFEDIENEVVV